MFEKQHNIEQQIEVEPKKEKEDYFDMSNNGPVNIEHANNVQISIKYSSSNSDGLNNSSNKNIPSPLNDNQNVKQSKILPWIETISKIISIISGIAVLLSVILLWFGVAIIGNIEINKLFTVFSFTLFSSLVSIGGVKMFSFDASLRKTQQQVQQVITASGGCPFVSVIDDDAKRLFQITNAYEIKDKKFCGRCHLVDHVNGRTTCKISPWYNN